MLLRAGEELVELAAPIQRVEIVEATDRFSVDEDLRDRRATSRLHEPRAGLLIARRVHVLVRALPVREYKTEDWWQHEQGIVAFQNEVLKYAYYRLKY